MTIESFLLKIRETPEQILFTEVIDLIDKFYTFSPTTFKNGNTINYEGQNSGSCKLFSFAKLQNLSQEQTLHCFGDFYRKDVLEFPEKEDHLNIRNFMLFGWSGISFEQVSLTKK